MTPGAGRAAYAARMAFPDPRPWAQRHVLGIDIALAMALMVVLLAFSIGGLGYYSIPLAVLLTFAETAPLALRRVAPLLAALLIAAACLLQLFLGYGPLPANVAVLLVVYSAAAWAPRRDHSFVVLGLGVVGAFLAAVNWQLAYTYDSTVLALGQMAVLTMAVGVAWVLGDTVRRRRLVSERQAAQERALARDDEQRTRLVAQTERAAIAREMHDIVAHSLAVVVVQADGGAYAARTAQQRGDTDPALDQAAGTLELLAQTARTALTDTRRLVGVLRDEPGAEYAPQQGLEHLADLVERVRSTGLPVELAVRGDVSALPPDADLAAYRVVQESLTNVLKHAGPEAHGYVDVLRTPAVLHVRVSDDGAAVGPPDGEGNGIRGMAERVQVLGGTLRAGPRPGGGFEVVASLPVPPHHLPVPPQRHDGSQP